MQAGGSSHPPRPRLRGRPPNLRPRLPSSLRTEPAPLPLYLPPQGLEPLLSLPGASQPGVPAETLAATPTGQPALHQVGIPLASISIPLFCSGSILPLSRLSAHSTLTLPPVQILLISQGPDQTFYEAFLDTLGPHFLF